MTKKTLIEKLNSELKQIDERLEVQYELEDVYGQDFEEYGIDDIEDTRHYSLILWTSDSSATVIKEHFDFTHHRSLQLGRSAERNLKFAGFTPIQISKIEKVLMSHKK